MSIPTFELSNGLTIPQIGLGTFGLPESKISEIFKIAIDAGYNMFDTAARYRNEHLIAQAIKDNHIDRNKIILQSKFDLPLLYFNPYRYGKGRFLNIRRPVTIAHEIEASFKRLNTDYIDIFLIHWPAPGFLKLYKVLEKFYKDGRIKALGVSSFLPPHLEYLMDNCEVKPVLNQFELSPLNCQKELIQYCLENDIRPEAMSTFSHFRSSEPRTEIINNPLILEIAKKHGKSTIQIINRWILQQGVAIVPKSKNPIHLRENIDLFNFSLSDEEMDKISSLDQGRFLNYDPTNMRYAVPKALRNSKWFK